MEQERPPGTADRLLYECPSCEAEDIILNQQVCGNCSVAMVWSGNPTDQPRVHPGDAGPDAPPHGQPAGLAGLADELNTTPVPPSADSASAASGSQEAEDKPASALATPGSLPGGSKPQPEIPEKEEPGDPAPSSVLPTPPKDQERKAFAVGAIPEAVPVLPEDPNPTAPRSGLKAHEIATVAHMANVAYRQVIGLEPGPSWLQADAATQDSCMAGVRKILSGGISSPQDSHKSWYDRKVEEGWTAPEGFDTVKSVAAKMHPNLASGGVWLNLPEVERRKDLLYLSIVTALIRPA